LDQLADWFRDWGIGCMAFYTTTNKETELLYCILYTASAENLRGLKLFFTSFLCLKYIGMPSIFSALLLLVAKKSN
jgi:hypothetical protein